MHRFFFNLYFFVLVSIFLTSIGANWIMNLYFQRNHQEQIVYYNQELSRGCFYLLEQDLLQAGEAAAADRIHELQAHFGYPIAVLPADQLHFTPKEQESFRNDTVIVREEGARLIQRLGTTEKAMIMGPFKEMEAGAIDHAVGFLIVAVIMGIFSMAWACYFWRELSRISSAAASFGGGNLSARVSIRFLSPIAAIARVFNAMAEQIEQLVASHKELINAVSHELRTPISRIRFGLEQVHSAGDLERARHIGGIRKDINELEDLVSELLGYAKLEGSKGRQDLPQRPLVPWLRELVKLARETLKVPITFVHDGLDDSFLAPFDPRLLERALHNLLQNADRFARTGIDLTLSSGNDAVYLIVEDDGPGIPEKDRERIFDPFVRLDSSRNREFGGYGLGLAIVKQIARCHQGRIVARTSCSGGTAFEMSWPLEPGIRRAG